MVKDYEERERSWMSKKNNKRRKCFAIKIEITKKILIKRKAKER